MFFKGTCDYNAVDFNAYPNETEHIVRKIKKLDTGV